MNKKTLVLILLGIIVVGAAGFWYYRDKVFSKEILKLEIVGPETTDMGQEVQYTVKYKNNGNFALESPKLIFEIPDDSLTEDGKTRLTKELKDIYPGEEGFMQFKARLLGKEGDVKVARAWLSYVPHNLSARYESDTTFTTKINAVPITFDFDLPKNIQEGTDTSFSMNYFSNIDYPLENLSIKLDALSGFAVKSASPASLDNIEWKLDTLQKGRGGKITVNGTFGQSTPSTVIFEAHLGMWQDGTFVVIKDTPSYSVAIGNASGDVPPPVSQKPSTHLTVMQKAYHKNDSNFENSGPIPPEVGKSTSYTVTWQLANDLNEVKNVTVSAALPKNVTLTAVAPESQILNVKVDSASHKIIWSVPSVVAGTGGILSPISVSFQVTLTPDVLNKGSVAGIIGEAIATGQDSVTQNTVSNTVPGIDTGLVDDPDNPGGGVVQ